MSVTFLLWFLIKQSEVSEVVLRYYISNTCLFKFLFFFGEAEKNVTYHKKKNCTKLAISTHQHYHIAFHKITTKLRYCLSNYWRGFWRRNYSTPCISVIWSFYRLAITPPRRSQNPVHITCDSLWQREVVTSRCHGSKISGSQQTVVLQIWQKEKRKNWHAWLSCVWLHSRTKR